jgi:ankyrin repeat protein
METSMRVMPRASAWCLASILVAGNLNAAPADTRLIEAVKGGNAASIRTVLAQGSDINARETDGTTALHWAVHRDDAATVALLLQAGANARTANDLGVTALALACANGNAAIIASLLKAGSDPNTGLPNGETPVMTTARTGNVEALKVLVDSGADVDAQESGRGQTALMWAAAQHQPAAVRFLIAHGADVHARSKAGFTPLLFSIRAGDVESVGVLLEVGADIDQKAPDGNTALMVAIDNARYEVAALLLDRGADPGAGPIGWTPLHALVRSRNPDKGAMPDPVPTGSIDSLDLAGRLISHHADLNARMTNTPATIYPLLNLVGATPFLLAAKNVDLPLMRLFVVNGADATLATKQGTTPLMVAAGVGYSQGNSPGSNEDALAAITLCLELGGDVRAIDQNGNTAMHGVALRGANAAVELLVAHGGRFDVRNEQGWLPVTIAEGVHIWPNFRAQAPTAALMHTLMATESSAGPAESQDSR